MARDYRAEYERRKAAGAARGLRPSDAAGQARRSAAAAERKAARAVERAARATREARSKAQRAEARRRGTDERRIGRHRVSVHKLGDKTKLTDALRGAAAKGHNVAIYTVWNTANGHDTHVIGGSRDDRGRKGDRIGDKPAGPVRIVEGTRAAMGGAGVPAKDLMAVLDEYLAQGLDFWDFLADWFDDEDLYG